MSKAHGPKAYAPAGFPRLLTPGLEPDAPRNERGYNATCVDPKFAGSIGSWARSGAIRMRDVGRLRQWSAPRF